MSREIPRWLIISTIAFTLLILAMAVAETNLWMHFLVDRGEYISVVGVAFITCVGFYLHRQDKLKASLPLFIPWLLYPVLTQGDQLIDNLSINQMRLVCDVILAIIFGAPILVMALAIHNFVSRLTRERLTTIVMALLAAEVWVAYEFLGWYLIWTLIGMGIAFLVIVSLKPHSSGFRVTESMALRGMIAAVIFSLGLFFGFKNRPGAYQGSPAAFMDPSQKDAVYDISRIAAPGTARDALSTDTAAEVHEVFAGYGDVLKGLVHAYWLMDRNYNYAFHNELFWRHTPVVPDFRTKALQEIGDMRSLAAFTDDRADLLKQRLPLNSAAGALLEEVREFVAYNLRRASTLEQMSNEFQRTKAGLQHATHLYEGEGKMVDVLLSSLVEKHKPALSASTLVAAADPFVESSKQVHRTYGNRIIGF